MEGKKKNKKWCNKNKVRNKKLMNWNLRSIQNG